MAYRDHLLAGNGSRYGKIRLLDPRLYMSQLATNVGRVASDIKSFLDFISPVSRPLLLSTGSRYGKERLLDPRVSLQQLELIDEYGPVVGRKPACLAETPPVYVKC